MDTPGRDLVQGVSSPPGGADKDRGRRIWVAWLRSRHLSVAKSLLKVPFAFTDKLFVHKQKEPVVVQHTGFTPNQRETLSEALRWPLQRAAGLNVHMKPNHLHFSVLLSVQII